MAVVISLGDSSSSLLGVRSETKINDYGREDASITWGSAAAATDVKSATASHRYLSWRQLSDCINAIKNQLDLPGAPVINMDIGLNQNDPESPLRLLVVYDKDYDTCDASFHNAVIGKFIALAAKHNAVLAPTDFKLVTSRKGSWRGIFKFIGNCFKSAVKFVKAVVREVIITPISKAVATLLGADLFDHKQEPCIEIHVGDKSRRLEQVIDVRYPLVSDLFLNTVIGWPIAWLTDNEPFHEGLVIKVGVRYYVVQCNESKQYCQYYDTEAAALKVIEDMRPFRSTTRAPVDPWSVTRKSLSTLQTATDLANIVRSIRPVYHLYNHNCQHFCAEVLDQLNGYQGFRCSRSGQNSAADVIVAAMGPSQSVRINGSSDLSSAIRFNNGGCVYSIQLDHNSGGFDYCITVDGRGPSGFGSGSGTLYFTDESGDCYSLGLWSSSRDTHTVKYNSNYPNIKRIRWESD